MAIIEKVGRARYYDGGIIRWLTPDPLADKYPGLTPYHYVQNDPINRIDPDGMEDWPAAIRAGFRIWSGYVGYQSGLGLMVVSAAAAPSSLGWSLVGISAGMGLMTIGAYNFGTGIHDLQIALIAPDGMKAEATKSLLGSLSTEFGGGKSLEKAFNVVEGKVGGNYKIPKNIS